MRRTACLFGLLLALVIVISGLSAQSSPRLVVILVVDQLRADYLQTFNRHWQGGFRLLLDEGLNFDNARYPYLGTVTCAGHSTIGTGTQPRTHGMVSNTWWDRESRRMILCTGDPDTPDITYGRPVRSGNSAKWMLAPTLADELRAQRPGARVVALSLKSYSAIGLAGHAGDAVVWFDDQAGSFATSRAYSPGPVPEVKAFIDGHPFEGDHGKVWTLSAPASTYVMRDAGVGERPLPGWSGLFPHPLVGRSGPDSQFFDLWQSTPFADAYLERMAESLIDSFALGQRDTTDFLGISFSVLDDVGHRFGPESREIEEVLRQLDATLKRLIAHLDAKVGRLNYMLALTADHGVAPIAMAPRGGRIAGEDVRERIDETLAAHFGPLAQGSYVEATSFSDVFLAPGLLDRLRQAPSTMLALEHALKEIPGITHVLRADQLSDRSPDPVVKTAALSHIERRSGDLVLVPREYWYFAGRANATATTHGTLHEYDQHVPLIIFGGSARRGHDRSTASPADIAPTLARFAGIRMSKAEGRNLPGTW
ncbi:MAG TPA: alkaline phosphatase family protein [Vicinamibacterales bacterium]|nr:alkaline phosphatase family protein [Vicinamibacterales bacterium]